MTKQIKGLGFDLDDSNPDTPKIVNPITGQGQRATYTDVLLFTLIERVEELTEVIKEQGSDRPPAQTLMPILIDNTTTTAEPAEEKSTEEKSPDQPSPTAEEPAADGDPAEELKTPPRRTSRSKKTVAEGDS